MNYSSASIQPIISAEQRGEKDTRLHGRRVVYILAVVILLVLGLFGIPQLIFPALGQPGSLFSSLGTIVSDFLLVLIPISFGIAILHYRLYDIDILINRTLVYGTLTVLLTLVYAGSVLFLQFLLSGFTGGNSLASVASTLASAALFQPLRQSIQNVTNRRFYRRKYDAARTLATFSETLRNEVDLNQLREHLLAVVEETMQPTHVSLWLLMPEQERKHTTKA